MVGPGRSKREKRTGGGVKIVYELGSLGEANASGGDATRFNTDNRKNRQKQHGYGIFNPNGRI